jgi:hypothetical protein
MSQNLDEELKKDEVENGEPPPGIEFVETNPLLPISSGSINNPDFEQLNDDDESQVKRDELFEKEEIEISDNED